MAEQLGIKGDIKSIHNNKFEHRYFETDSGKISYVWWAADTAGLVGDEKEYFEKQVPRAKGRTCKSEPW
ncbi:MAG: hypothetical protein HYY51_03245 [Candidatus Magasanikbacteria bacterium]|nr:hypothetical protein [Candidatus Magasanikbacteria bacterium]